MSSTLSLEKAYNIPHICAKYDLGDGSAYQSPASKEKFIKNLLYSKEETFIVGIAKRVAEEYRSDKVAAALNSYYDGKFFKLSIVTRQELLKDLYSLGDLNGNKNEEDFLQECDIIGVVSNDGLDVLMSLFGGKSVEKREKKSLNQRLQESNLHEVMDSRFFSFLEQIVHPYTRDNASAAQYVSIIARHLLKDGLQFVALDEISGQQVYKVVAQTGVQEGVKNLIFASSGYKPEIVFDDALSNRIRIVRNAADCLIYNRPIKSNGLLWVDLVEWWSEERRVNPSAEQAAHLKVRLSKSLASPPEIVLFETYYQVFSKRLKRNLPALIPQVYLHYDPYSLKTYGVQYLTRQRMDFLLLLSNTARVVIEVDGKQHCAEGNVADPDKYANMVSQDRELKLSGYEVYRFGGFELTESNRGIVVDFFEKLFAKHGVDIPKGH